MNIAVYCSSSNHIAENYKQSAYQLGKWIAKTGNVLVFGGATGGLMTSVSEGSASEKGRIVGIIPEAIINMKRQSVLCTELIVVSSLNERKEKMKKIADIFVILPGSFGTLDEMFDVITSGIVGEHKKSLIVVNENGFYNDLLNQVEKMRQENFIPVENYKPTIVDNIDNCITTLKLFC